MTRHETERAMAAHARVRDIDGRCGRIHQIGGEMPYTKRELASDEALIGWDDGRVTPADIRDLSTMPMQD